MGRSFNKPLTNETPQGVLLTTRRESMILTTPEQIEQFQLLATYQALKLECLGLKHSQGSVYALVKRRFGFKGSKQSVLKQLGQLLGKE